MSSRGPFSAAVVSATLLCSGCGEGGDAFEGPFDLTLRSTDFAVHEGRRVSAAVVSSDHTVVASPTSETIADGAFSFTWPELLARGGLYELDLYVDVDASGDCTAPPGDPVWGYALGPVGGHTTVTLSYSTAYSDVCASFAP